MKQRVISMVLAAAMVLGLCMPVGAEAAQTPPVVQVGRACPEGIYTMMYRSDLSMEDLPHNYRYGDQLFDAPATEYDHELALATLGLTIASSNTLDRRQAGVAGWRPGQREQYPGGIPDPGV